MSAFDWFRNAVNQLNGHLVSLTGASLADLAHKDLLGNKFNLTMFSVLITFSSTFLILFCIGLTYDCCSCCSKGSTKKGDRTTSSISYKEFEENVEMSRNDPTGTESVPDVAVTSFKSS